MKHFWYVFSAVVLWAASSAAQHTITIGATLLPDSKTVRVQQEIIFKNTSDGVLTEIYLNDWANSFSKKTTALAERFAENYDNQFHFEKEAKRGRTTIGSISYSNGAAILWDRGKAEDIIHFNLKDPLPPGKSVSIELHYSVQLPDAKFTGYGVTGTGDFHLKYWFVSPCVYNGAWQNYSNKNTDDFFLLPSHFNIKFNIPNTYKLFSDLDVVAQTSFNTINTVVLQGKNRVRAVMHIEKKPTFEKIGTGTLEVTTNIKGKKVGGALRALAIDRAVRFLGERLGSYPFKKMLATQQDYKNSPVYGLNQLPDFINPFPKGFEYDIQQFKTISRQYLENTLLLHPRKDHWLLGALQIYLMMEYVNVHYPKMKIIGSFSDFWVIKWAHAATLEFNDQYPLLYLNMARNNLHQKLTTPKDSLVKFNKNIANDYYGGTGLQYLSDYLGEGTFQKSIKQFYARSLLKPTRPRAFQTILEQNTTLPVAWFFEDFVGRRTTIDFKIKKVEKQGDSLKVTLRNKRDNVMPVSVYGLNTKKEVVFKKWTAPVDSVLTVTVPAKNVNRLALDHGASIPEYNRRNNFKKVKGLLNRPLQFRLFQDVQDPNYNQLFFMPVFEYNFYDGFSLGPKLYNKTLLPKAFHYKLEPQYGVKSNTVVGSGSLSYTQLRGGNTPYAVRYGFSGNYYSYDEGLFYRRFTPFLTFAFRKNDLRNNQKQYVNLRSVNVMRDLNPNDPGQDPNYSIFNASYVYSNRNLINYYNGKIDYQIGKNFSKIALELEYRKLFLNNRQLNIRLYAGTFIKNNTRENGNFFSFALDRPTDYLFDYNYYGRSEESGVLSQQLIVAEGGFKSKLRPAFANNWITTVNASTNIWKWIFAYGDAGLVNSKGRGTKAVFGTGIRLNLVADYFELYFPLYSNLGWEPALPGYDQKIRFIVTLSPRTLLGLFTREWY